MNQQIKKTFGLLRYFGSSLLTVIGVVLIWRGIWILLDLVDARFFQDNPIFSAAGGILLGLLLLFLPDKDLKEIEGPLRSRGEDDPPGK
jgi:hypothetical protein